MYTLAEHDEITGLLRYLDQQLDALRATHRLRGSAATMDPDAMAAYTASFVPGPGETTTALIAEFDAARAEYLEAFAAADPDAPSLEPPAPWHGRFTEQPIRLRYYLTHQIEEMARHAGHADTIREQLDGMSVPSLVLTLEGAPANDFFQPYTPLQARSAHPDPGRASGRGVPGTPRRGALSHPHHHPPAPAPVHVKIGHHHRVGSGQIAINFRDYPRVLSTSATPNPAPWPKYA